MQNYSIDNFDFLYYVDLLNKGEFDENTILILLHTLNNYSKINEIQQSCIIKLMNEAKSTSLEITNDQCNDLYKKYNLKFNKPEVSEKDIIFNLEKKEYNGKIDFTDRTEIYETLVDPIRFKN